MANPRRQSDEPVKIIQLRLPWSLYEQIKDQDSVNAEIVRLLKVAIDAEKAE